MKDLLSKLDEKKINEIDLTCFDKYVRFTDLNFFHDKAGREHYRLLAYISTLYDNQTFLEIGTLNGLSAMALGFNFMNNVISYDVMQTAIASRIGLPNIKFKIGDVLDSLKMFSKSVSLIFMDTMHDGIFEQEVYDFLEEIKWRGVLLLDDIHLNQMMIEFWQNINRPKHDITNFGHLTGTGLVIFKEEDGF